MANDKSPTNDFKKCMACAYSIWPQHSLGHCIVHQVGTMAARDKSGACGPDAINYVDKPVSGAENGPVNMEDKTMNK